ncbi:hypothetical protein, partial [Hymenobacter cheonanensis]|uniref:hypothetical protein n=1 Tax=Hymenobacter sp. CA2-7 TaxID=3063993 RepID=UPI00271402E8
MRSFSLANPAFLALLQGASAPPPPPGGYPDALVAGYAGRYQNVTQKTTYTHPGQGSAVAITVYCVIARTSVEDLR